MLKFQQAINMGIASILVIPAVALQGEETNSLEEALESTISALDSLVRIRDERDLGNPETRAMLSVVTEAPIASGPQRDQYLDELRRDVNILTMEFDNVKIDPAPREMIQGKLAEQGASFDSPNQTRQMTTGLSDADRRQISGIAAPLPGVRHVDPKVTLEIEEADFVVDTVLLGRSYYRAERFTEGALLLATEKENAEGIYWYGRCLEKLDRFDEAIVAYGAVLEQTESTYLADRAQNDLEFLTWKREFQAKINRNQQNN